MVLITVLMILGTLVSQSMCRKMNDETGGFHELWMYQYGRSYVNSEEKVARLEIFRENLEFIENFNNGGNKKSYKLGINEFADMSNAEFIASHTGFKMFNPRKLVKATSFRFYNNLTEIPSSLDWRDYGAVSPIKNQGQCGSCWAFSAVAAVEGIVRIKTGKLSSLSEQQLLDCSTDNGCSGGDMNDAFNYIIQTQGLTTETEYPYQGIEGTCYASSPVAYIDGYEDVPCDDEEALLKAVAHQPVSVAIDASGFAFQSYSGGIFSGDCGTELNHGVTIVGYGTTDDGIDYWLVKNSWGESWGENGYMRIQRNTDSPHGLCGIAMTASYPTA